MCYDNFMMNSNNILLEIRKKTGNLNYGRDDNLHLRLQKYFSTFTINRIT